MWRTETRTCHGWLSMCVVVITCARQCVSVTVWSLWLWWMALLKVLVVNNCSLERVRKGSGRTRVRIRRQEIHACHPCVFVKVCVPGAKWGVKGDGEGLLKETRRRKGQRWVKEVALHRREQCCVTVYSPEFQSISLIYSPDLLPLSSDKTSDWLFSSCTISLIHHSSWADTGHMQTCSPPESFLRSCGCGWVCEPVVDCLWVCSGCGGGCGGCHKSEMWSLNPNTHTHILNPISSLVSCVCVYMGGGG